MNLTHKRSRIPKGRYSLFMYGSIHKVIAPLTVIRFWFRLLDENINIGYIPAALLFPVLHQSICTPLQILKSPARYWGSKPILLIKNVDLS
jgi:hypothetical protein